VCLIYSKEVHNNTIMTVFTVGSQLLYVFETHGIGQTPSSLECYLVAAVVACLYGAD